MHAKGSVDVAGAGIGIEYDRRPIRSRASREFLTKSWHNIVDRASGCINEGTQCIHILITVVIVDDSARCGRLFQTHHA